MTANEARRVAEEASVRAATAGVMRNLAEDILDLLVAEGVNRIKLAVATRELAELDEALQCDLAEEDVAWDTYAALNRRETGRHDHDADCYCLFHKIERQLAS